jgi:hypothetical protein
LYAIGVPRDPVIQEAVVTAAGDNAAAAAPGSGGGFYTSGTASIANSGADSAFDGAVAGAPGVHCLARGLVRTQFAMEANVL